MARGDLVEVTPASYGVMTRAFHFWSGEGRGDDTGRNLYENFAEATSGKGTVLGDSGVNFADDVENMESAAEEEEAMDKANKAVLAKAALQKRLHSQDGTLSAPGGAQLADPTVDGLKTIAKQTEEEAKEAVATLEETRSQEAIENGDGEDKSEVKRTRASECIDVRGVLGTVTDDSEYLEHLVPR